MTFYIIANVKCPQQDAAQCLSAPQKGAIADGTLVITAVVIGILGMISIIPMPPAAAYSLFAFSGLIITADAVYFTVAICRKKQTSNPPAEPINKQPVSKKIEPPKPVAPKQPPKVTPRIKPKVQPINNDVPVKPEDQKPQQPETKVKKTPVDNQQNKPSSALQLPTTYYTLKDDQLTLSYWNSASLSQDQRPDSKAKAKIHPFPVAASPSHGDQFMVPGSQRQNIIFDEGTCVTHMDFQLPHGATFMKPNVDTMLTCCGIHDLLGKGLSFKNAIDIGAGSGFIAKYTALKNPQAQVTAIDIDPKAAQYMRSAQADMPANVKIVEGDAITHLTNHGDSCDLIVSNPPYVPSVQETQSDQKINVMDKSFWEGTGMIAHMLEDTLPKMPAGGHLVVVIPSTSLKSKRLAKIFQEYAPDFQARVLYQQEVAYKAWFAGNNKVGHLLATAQEKKTPTHFKGANLDLFVGITNPGEPRDCKVEDGRREDQGYYWQMIYIVDFFKKAS